MKNISIYIHWPFCKSKCPYCDFNSYANCNIEHDIWQKAYIKAIESYRELLAELNVTSIYFGGGTPSLMQPQLVGSIIQTIADLSNLTDDVEITLEANPTSAEAKKLCDFKNAGVNRLSLGLQSLDDKHLRFLERDHSAKEAMHTLDEVAALFENYSFDLIYALPEQTLNQWKNELYAALFYAKHHISIYQLTIEKDTQFYNQHKAGRFQMPHEELSSDFYQITTELTKAARLKRYEISNYARTESYSKHNLTYWKCMDYIGIGPGACGRYSAIALQPDSITSHSYGKNYTSLDRSSSTCKPKTLYSLKSEVHWTEDHKSPDKWLSAMFKHGNGISKRETLSSQQQLQDQIMMGLRLAEGVPESLLDGNAALPELMKLGLLMQESGRIKASDSGVLVLNSILSKLL